MDHDDLLPTGPRYATRGPRPRGRPSASPSSSSHRLPRRRPGASTPCATARARPWRRRARCRPACPRRTPRRPNVARPPTSAAMIPATTASLCSPRIVLEVRGRLGEPASGLAEDRRDRVGGVAHALHPDADRVELDVLRVACRPASPPRAGDATAPRADRPRRHVTGTSASGSDDRRLRRLHQPVQERDVPLTVDRTDHRGVRLLAPLLERLDHLRDTGRFGGRDHLGPAAPDGRAARRRPAPRPGPSRATGAPRGAAPPTRGRASSGTSAGRSGACAIATRAWCTPSGSASSRTTTSWRRSCTTEVDSALPSTWLTVAFDRQRARSRSPVPAWRAVPPRGRTSGSDPASPAPGRAQPVEHLLEQSRRRVVGDLHLELAEPRRDPPPGQHRHLVVHDLTQAAGPPDPAAGSCAGSCAAERRAAASAVRT